MSVLPATSEQNPGIKPLSTPDWDAKDRRLNKERLRQAIVWNPRVGLEEGIRRSAAGFQSH